jgi:hypothetical protein
MGSSSLSPDEQDALRALAGDLRRVFGTRLHSVLAYGVDGQRRDEQPLHTLALVEHVTFDDLAACAPAADTWGRRGLAVPLVISRDEFLRTLDVFPLEYDEIITDHIVIEGVNPFTAVRVPESDLRRAIELQAKSHLIHLREGFLESGRNPKAIARLVAASAPAFRTLLANIARLNGHAAGSDDAIAESAARTMNLDGPTLREVFASPTAATAAVDPSALLSRYIAAVEEIWRYVDRWRAR